MLTLLVSLAIAEASRTAPRVATVKPTPANSRNVNNSITLTTSPVSLSRSIRMLQVVGAPILVDLRSAFVAPQNVRLNYSLVGAPAGTGIRVNSTGFLLGAANSRDLAARQPLILAVTAQGTDGSQGAIALLVSVIDRTPVADKLLAFFAYTGAPISPINVTEGFKLRAPLTYTITGLPAGSGLGLNRTNGVFFGVPVGIDVTSQQPLRIVIRITDAGRVSKTLAIILAILPFAPPVSELPIPEPPRVDGFDLVQGYLIDASLSLGGYKSATAQYCATQCSKATKCVGFNFDSVASACTLLSGLAPATSAPTIFLYVRQVPAELVLVSLNFAGDAFSYNFSSVFPPRARQMSATGLPRGSGLRLSNGILSGVPNTNDATAKQPLMITVTALEAPPNPQNYSALLILTIARTKPRGTVVATLGSVAHRLLFPLSPHFSAGTSRFTITGLPSGTGLAIEDNNISGLPTEADARASQPIYATVSGRDATGRSSSITVLVTIIRA